MQSIDGGAVNHGKQWWDNSTQQNMLDPASTQISATLTKQPTEGNVLIATVGLQTLLTNSPFYSINVSSITQDGVTWTRQAGNSYRGWSSGVEIWLGIVGANAASTLTFNVAVDPAIPDFVAAAYAVCEYSGVATAAPLDQTAVSHSTDAKTNTGKTAPTTAPNELWIGAVYVESSVNQISGLNGFSLVGGTTRGTEGRITTALLERVATEKAEAWSGSEISGQNMMVGYIGCIATFYGSDQTPRETPSPSPLSGNGTALQFTCQSVAAANIKVNIEGSLSGNGTGIAGEPVIFTYSVNNGASWLDLTCVNTDEQGCFSVTWTPQVTGNYLIKADWAGNAAFGAASTTVSLAIAATQSQSSFTVNSNSTLSALSFDSDSQQLGFSVSGPDGTCGYVEVYVPKTLLSEASGLTVTMDGTPVQFSYQSMGDAWLISFSYHHSSHQVTMNLNGAEAGGAVDSMMGWIVAAAVLVPLAILVAVIGLDKKGRAKKA
ncbi:MAG: hypothetical protein NWE93_07360 [Candidatus Bathyarchaeota archaeon]|nr:hypothetical protein [Candidatus Bathyarchaeota archaeon]